MSHRMLPTAFFPDRPPLPWQRNLGQNGYNSACVTDFGEILRL